MSLVGKVGRKRPRARLAMLCVYLLLSLGAVTTLYPFLLMVGTGLKGPSDQDDNRIVPAYFTNMEGKDIKGKPDPSGLFEKYLEDKYAGDMPQIASTRIGASASSEEVQAYEQFLMKLPLDFWTAGFRTAPSQVTGRLVKRYQDWLSKRYKNIDELNQAYSEQNGALQQVVVPPELLEQKVWQPVRDRKYLEWLEFKASLPAQFRIPIREDRLFQLFMLAKTKNQFDQVPRSVAGTAKTFEELTTPSSGTELDEFVATRLPDRFKLHAFTKATPGPPPAAMVSNSVEMMWGRGALPIAAFEKSYVAANATSIKAEFASRNLTYVLSYILLNGRVLVNTFIFCALAVLLQLTVNPLAAYALSRYPIKASMKILLFLLATMAFPAEVAMIPSFLLLKNLGLLNTFAALVLPTAASGYMIFLLKGFFDSLPKELYEAAEIDGAKETTLMRKVAIPLSGPVLGYMALLAFMGAYGAFMYAFLVAQNRSIWTLMVWIFQLQGSAPKSVMMAALTVAAIPTLVVFLLAQKFILRGIVLPGEK